MSKSYLMIGIAGKVSANDGYAHALPPGDALCFFEIGAQPHAPVPAGVLALPHRPHCKPGADAALMPAPRTAAELAASAQAATAQGEKCNAGQGNTLCVVDLRATPPRLKSSIKLPHASRWLAINPRATLALASHRQERSISVLARDGGAWKQVDTLVLGRTPGALRFDADGRRVFVVLPEDHRLGVLRVDGIRVSCDAHEDIATGLNPCDVALSPDGRLAITADAGSPAGSDGHADTLSVVALDAAPPRVIDRIMVEDGPTAVAFSADGRYAAATLATGSSHPRDAWFHQSVGKVALLKITGKQVTRTDVAMAGALPCAVAFSPDGAYVYVGNFLDASIAVLQVENDRLRDTGRRIALPGRPTSIQRQSAGCACLALAARA